MIQTIHAYNVPDAFVEGKWAIQAAGVEEDSRNGPVITVPHPVVLEIERPWERVLFDPVRDANPFFHVMEFVWMMAGSNDAKWISQFNKRMMDYADDGILRGAYGWRWANPSPQIQDTISLLQTSPTSRQAVISMWDPVFDGSRARTSDRPCNTHLYFRVVGGYLDLTVCNRSNDFFWGMLGSNVVHFTLLHEFISLATGIPQGRYRVMTNNLHVYKDMPRFQEIWNHRTRYDYYKTDDLTPMPLLQEGEQWEDFMGDAKYLVEGGLQYGWRTEWFQKVAELMFYAYLEKDNRDELIREIAAEDWRISCSEWNLRRNRGGTL